MLGECYAALIARAKEEKKKGKEAKEAKEGKEGKGRKEDKEVGEDVEERIMATLLEAKQIAQDVLDLVHLLKHPPSAEDEATLEAKHEADVARAQKLDFVMSNYLTIGLDGRILHGFHNFREKKPEYFRSRFINYGWFTVFTVKSAVARSTTMDKLLTLRVDGQPVRIKKGAVGLIVLNIPSYAAGCDPWGTKAPNPGEGLNKQHVGDRKVEVILLESNAQRLNIQTHVGLGTPLAQAHKVELVIREPIQAQVDGEPWLLNPCTLLVSHHNQATMLLNTDKDKKGKQEARLYPDTAGGH